MLRLLAAAVFGLSIPASAEVINFSPNYETKVEDGTPVRLLYFSTGSKRIYLYPPNSWEVRGGAEAITFISKKDPESQVRIENATAGMPAAFDEKGIEEYRAIARGQLPAEVMNITDLPDRKDVIEINEWKGHEISFQYIAYSRLMIRSVVFVKMDRAREIRLVITALEDKFPAFRDAVLANLGSWDER